jgi:hypothetical protein
MLTSITYNNEAGKYIAIITILYINISTLIKD